MLLSAAERRLDQVLDEVRFAYRADSTPLRAGDTVLIKVNLARPPEPGHPRTDPELLRSVLAYLAARQARCTIAECADGHLADNLAQIGLAAYIRDQSIKVLDLDLEPTTTVVIRDEVHHVPQCLRRYALRIGIPATSKRPGAIFSNNVKLFVGAVPRRMYQLDEPTTWRPRVHLDLHKSVASIHRAVQEYAPFTRFVNGGTAVIEGRGEFRLPQVLVGDDAVQIDRQVLDLFDLPVPEYITQLEEDCRDERF
jgi:uncharacterized protein (DUF362 family)